MVWKDRRTVKQLGRSGKDYKNRLSIRRKKKQPSKEKLKDRTGRGSSIKKDVRGIKKREVHGKLQQFAWVEHKVWEQDIARRSR